MWTTGNKRNGTNVLHWPGERLLALLLVGTLLVCHGVLGVMHLCSTPPVLVHQDHEHSSLVEKGVVAHEHPPCHLAGADYFAVVLTAFLGFVLGLLLERARFRVGVVAPRLPGYCLPSVVLHLPRGPTLPVLQVFRL